LQPYAAMARRIIRRCMRSAARRAGGVKRRYGTRGAVQRVGVLVEGDGAAAALLKFRQVR